MFKGEGRKSQNIIYKLLFDRMSILAGDMRSAASNQESLEFYKDIVKLQK